VWVAVISLIELRLLVGHYDLQNYQSGTSPKVSANFLVKLLESAYFGGHTIRK